MSTVTKPDAEFDLRPYIRPENPENVFFSKSPWFFVLDLKFS